MRGIKTGDNPEKTAQAAPDTPASLNAAGKVAQKLDMSEDARAHYEAALQKLNARDGKGCLAELDEHDKRDAKHQSTDPKSGIGHIRSQCLMMAGKCDAGKELARKSFEANQASMMDETTVENAVEAYVSIYCQGGNMSPRDQLLKALRELQDGAYVAKKDKAVCLSAYQTVRKLAPQVKPRDEDDIMIIQGPKNLYATAPNCVARAGDCEGAWKVFSDAYVEDPGLPPQDQKYKDETRKRLFGTLVKRCKK